MLRRQAGASAPPHFPGEAVHGLLRDGAPLATSKRGFGLIDSGKNFRTGALPFFPEGQGFPHRIFFAAKPSACNGLTSERLLVRAELHFHHFQSTANIEGRQAFQGSG